MKNKSNSVLEIIFFITISLLIISVVLFLCFSMYMEVKNNQIVSDKYISDIKSIMDVTDNAINRINNILVVATIFFTIMVASISFFQFIKGKDVDNLKADLGNTVEHFNNLTDQKIEESNLKFKELENTYNETIKQLKESFENKIGLLEKQYNEHANTLGLTVLAVNNKIGSLKEVAAGLEADINYFEAKQKHDKQDISLNEIKKHYDKILDIIREYPTLSTKDYLADVYYRLADVCLTHKGTSIESDLSYDEILKLLEKADKINDNSLLEERICRCFVKLEKEYGKYIDREIHFLERIYFINPFDFKIPIEIAATYDRRNKKEDLETAISYLKCAVDRNKVDAKTSIICAVQNGEFRNLKQSNLSERLNKIMNIYDNVELKGL